MSIADAFWAIAAKHWAFILEKYKQLLEEKQTDTSCQIGRNFKSYYLKVKTSMVSKQGVHRLLVCFFIVNSLYFRHSTSLELLFKGLKQIFLPCIKSPILALIKPPIQASRLAASISGRKSFEFSKTKIQTPEYPAFSTWVW